jgi:branched-chain amino acid aminotransferase
VSEAPGENIFIVKNDILITPPLSSSALDGITRKSILEFSKNMKIKSKIKKMSSDELKKADEVFLTGTAAEITPVIKIETKRIGNGKVGYMTKQIMNAYSEIVMNNNKKFSKWLTNVY